MQSPPPPGAGCNTRYGASGSPHSSSSTLLKSLSQLSGSTSSEASTSNPMFKASDSQKMVPKPPTVPRPEYSMRQRRGPRPPSAKRPPDAIKVDVPSDEEQESDDDFEELMESIERLPYKERMWATKVPQRALVAGLAVSLLWGTSLVVIRFIVEELFFPKPSFNETYTSMSNLFEEAEFLKAARTFNANVSLQECQNEYDLDHSAELERVFLANISNTDFLYNFNISRDIAKKNLNEVLGMTVALVQADASLIDFYTAPSDADLICPRVLDWVNGQISAALAQGTYDDFVGDTDQALADVNAQLTAREEYNEQYIAEKEAQMAAFNAELADEQSSGTSGVLDKVSATLADFMACYGVESTNGTSDASCSSEESFTDAFSGMSEGFQDIFSDFGATISALQEQTNEFFEQLNDLNDVAESAGLATAETEESSPPDSSGMLETVDSAGETDDVGEMEALLNDILASAEEAITAVFDAGENAIDDFTNAAQDAIGLGDYDPPPLDMEDVIAAWNETKEANQEDFDDATDDYASTEGDELSDFEDSPDRETNFPEQDSEDITSFTDRVLSLYAYSEDLFRTIEVNLTLAVNFGTYFDVLYRIIHTILIINKYWNISSIGKPPGDARIDMISGKGWGHKASSSEKMAARLTNPVTINGFAFLVVIFLTTIFWAAYSPLYDHFTQGCVLHDAEEIAANPEYNGTMIYRNLLTYQTSYIVQDADKLTTTEVEKFNLKRQGDCRTNSRESSENYENQFNSYTAMYKDYMGSKLFRDEIVACMKLDEMDLALNQADVDFSSVALMMDPAYEFEVVDLEVDVYNCTDIPLCSISIEADPAIEDSTHASACGLELWLHGSILASGMVILTYWLTYMFRKLFMESIVRLWWRNLSPYGNTFLASCTINGDHVDPETVTEEGETFKRAVRDAVHVAIRKWEKAGLINLVLSVTYNVPWIAACVFLSNGLKYDFE